MAAKKGLGKGLDTLIPSNVLDSADNKQKAGKAQTPDSVVDINKVEPNRDQPRKNFDEDALEDGETFTISYTEKRVADQGQATGSTDVDKEETTVEVNLTFTAQ